MRLSLETGGGLLSCLGAFCSAVHRAWLTATDTAHVTVRSDCGVARKHTRVRHDMWVTCCMQRMCEQVMHNHRKLTSQNIAGCDSDSQTPCAHEVPCPRSFPLSVPFVFGCSSIEHVWGGLSQTVLGLAHCCQGHHFGLGLVVAQLSASTYLSFTRHQQ